MMRKDTTKVSLSLLGHWQWTDLKNLSVIYQCGLKRDLTLFEAGDQTEVGEKGLTLRLALFS